VQSAVEVGGEFLDGWLQLVARDQRSADGEGGEADRGSAYWSSAPRHTARASRRSRAATCTKLGLEGIFVRSAVVVGKTS
jgi:hypothetical protein